MNKRIIWLAVFILVGALGYWIYKGITKPLPGQAVADKGREHVTDIFGKEYSSNPPTSGPHFPVWAKSGVYDRLISDGYLIHSMEHGYVVIWYDCSRLSSRSFVKQAFAHDEPAKESTDSGQLLMHMKVQPQGNISWFTPQNPPEVEIELPEAFKSDACKTLVSNLSEFTKVAERVIVVPRLNLDSQVALTSWGRIDKMDSLDKGRIEVFIKAFHNKGPEKTME